MARPLRYTSRSRLLSDRSHVRFVSGGANFAQRRTAYVDNIVRDFSIALIGAVIGGLIGARVDRRLAAVSSWYRARTAASRAKRESVVVVLSANPHVLAVAYLDALVGVVILAALFAIFAQFRNTIDTAPLLGSVAVSPEVVAQSWTGTLVLTLMAVLLMIVGYFVSRRISVAQEAWRRLGQTNGLPKFW